MKEFVNMNCKFNLLAMIFLLLFTAGCSINQRGFVKINYPEDIKATDLWESKELKNRFAQYWNNRFSFDGTLKNYKIEAPFFQAMYPQETYESYVKNAGRNELMSIIVKDIEYITDNLLKVNCVITFKMPGGREEKLKLPDTWVYAGKQWYHVLKDQLFFPDAM